MFDNPQAFPVPPSQMFPSGDISFSELGMSLRDYFAAKAMLGILNRAANFPRTATDAEMLHDVSAASYELADAMLAAREVKS